MHIHNGRTKEIDVRMSNRFNLLLRGVIIGPTDGLLSDGMRPAIEAKGLIGQLNQLVSFNVCKLFE